MKQKWLIPLLILLLFAAEARAEVVLILRREAQPAGNYVRICDVARVEGPDDQVREVAMTVLGPSPGKGESREFTRWDLENRLYEMGIASRVSFSGNDSVRVYGNGAARAAPRYDSAAFLPLEPLPVRSLEQRRGDAGTAGQGKTEPLAKPAPRRFDPPDRPAAMALTDDARRRVGLAVSNYLAERYKQNGSKRTDIEVEANITSASSEIPYTAYDVQVEGGLDGRVPGKARLQLVVKDTVESQPRRVEVEADTQVFARALVAARQLSRGESLEKQDVTVTRVRMEAGKSYLPPSLNAIAGREVSRNLRNGDPILAEDAIPGQAVKRGEWVVVNAMGKGWLLQSKGKALGAGMVGDMISVEDSNNKTKYSARITGRGEVEVVVKKDLTKK